MAQLSRFVLRVLSTFAVAGATAGAHATCTSDGVRAPEALLERFINADCAACWSDAKTPSVGSRTLALDWVVPGAAGDQAPLSAAATRDGSERLATLGRRTPATADHVRTRAARPLALRVAQGVPFNDYIGTSIELRRPDAARGPLTAWLLLVEELPPGAEGSTVGRRLVRNALRLEWRNTRGAVKLRETRAMRIPEGAQPLRLRVVGFAVDARGGLAGIARTACPA